MNRSPLLDSLRPGLRLAERPEAPGFLTPLSFGPVPEEYAAARRGCALIDVTDRGRLTVSGRDALDFLHRLLANHVKSLAPGSLNSNLLLSPKGKVQFEFTLLRNEDALLLSTPPGAAGPLRTALERFHFSEQVTFEETSHVHAPLELRGGTAQSVLQRLLGLDLELAVNRSWRSSWRSVPLEIQRLGPLSWRLDGGPESAVELFHDLSEAGATPVGLVVRESLRVEAARALFGCDIDENVYPQEAGLEGSFALDKGCYVGQEVVAKIDTYGGLNKRLVALAVSHSDAIPRGTRLYRTEDRERRELGLVTSWAYSFALDTGLVLAYVKRRHQQPGTAFELDAGRGTAEIVLAPRPE